MKAFVPATGGKGFFYTLLTLILKIKFKKKGISSINEIKEKNMITPTYQEVQQLAKEHNLVPICKEIFADIVTPISILRKILNTSKKNFLLESVEGEKSGADIPLLVLIQSCILLVKTRG